MPDELKILCNGLEEIEGIIYGMRNKIYQLYGPVDYSKPEDIALRFTEEQEIRLDFKLQGDYWIIKPKQFLGTDMFAEISNTVRTMGGEYISAGRDSHFKVRKA